MHVPTSQPREENIAYHHDLLGFGWNALESQLRADDTLVHRPARGERRFLAMGDHGDPERSRVLQLRPHQLRAGDRLAIIANRHRTRTHHFPKLSEHFAVLSDGYRADRIDP